MRQHWPYCGAAPGEYCIGYMGRTRISNHMERVEVAKEARVKLAQRLHAAQEAEEAERKLMAAKSAARIASKSPLPTRIILHGFGSSLPR